MYRLEPAWSMAGEIFADACCGFPVEIRRIEGGTLASSSPYWYGRVRTGFAPGEVRADCVRAASFPQGTPAGSRWSGPQRGEGRDGSGRAHLDRGVRAQAADLRQHGAARFFRAQILPYRQQRAVPSPVWRFIPVPVSPSRGYGACPVGTGFAPDPGTGGYRCNRTD